MVLRSLAIVTSWVQSSFVLDFFQKKYSPNSLTTSSRVSTAENDHAGSSVGEMKWGYPGCSTDPALALGIICPRTNMMEIGAAATD